MASDPELFGQDEVKNPIVRVTCEASQGGNQV